MADINIYIIYIYGIFIQMYTEWSVFALKTIMWQCINYIAIYQIALVLISLTRKRKKSSEEHWQTKMNTLMKLQKPIWVITFAKDIGMPVARVDVLVNHFVWYLAMKNKKATLFIKLKYT